MPRHAPFCWLDKPPTTGQIKKLTLCCQVIGIGQGNGVESSSLYVLPNSLLAEMLLGLKWVCLSECVADGAVHRQQHHPAPPPPPQWANNGWPPPREDKQSTLSRWVSEFWTYYKNWRVRERERGSLTGGDLFGWPYQQSHHMFIIGKNILLSFNVLIIPSFLFSFLFFAFSRASAWM